MFAARLLLGEFVTGYEVSGWYGVGAPKGTPVEVIDELNKEIQGIIDRDCAWHFVTSPRRCAELDWRHPPRIDNDRTNNPNWGRAGLERAQLELSVIMSQLRLRGLLE